MIALRTVSNLFTSYGLITNISALLALYVVLVTFLPLSGLPWGLLLVNYSLSIAIDCRSLSPSLYRYFFTISHVVFHFAF